MIHKLKVEGKHFLWGVGILLVSAWFASRFLPGAAARAGIRPRPLFDAQNTLPEPIGLVRLKDYFSGSTSPGASVTAAPSQESLGASIVASTTAAVNSASASLASITGGGGAV